MMDKILDNCEGVIGTVNNIITHGKDDIWNVTREVTSDKAMKVTTEHGLVLNKKKYEVEGATLSSSLVVFVTSMEPIQIHQRSMPSKRYLPHRTKESSRASLEW